MQTTLHCLYIYGFKHGSAKRRQRARPRTTLKTSKQHTHQTTQQQHPRSHACCISSQGSNQIKSNLYTAAVLYLSAKGRASHGIPLWYSRKSFSFLSEPTSTTSNSFPAARTALYVFTRSGVNPRHGPHLQFKCLTFNGTIG